MSASWVVVASFFSEIQMSLIRNQLELAGIETQIQDEHIAALREFSSGSANGIKILVKDDQYEEAMQKLIELGHYKAADFEATWLEKLLNKWFKKSA